VFYESVWDSLMPAHGWAIRNEADIIGLLRKSKIGLRWSYTHPYIERDEDQRTYNTHRLGPFFAYTFSDKGRFAKFNQPTLFVLAQWWLKHNYRAGQEVNQAFPLIALGISFNGTLWQSAK